jgi:uncharacterized protein (DUF58 family)
MSSELQEGGASRVIRLTRRGVVTGIVGVIVITLGYAFHRTEVLFLGWFALLVPVAAVIFVSLRRVRIDVSRAFSHPLLIAARPAVGQLELRNLSPYASAEARWREALPWQSSPTDSERLAPIPGRTAWRNEPRLLRYSFTPPRRGRFTVGPMTLELSDPFALARSEIPVGGTQLITVIPEIERLPHSGLTVIADDGSARVQRLRSLGGDDDAMTRNYRSGDALRRVHWRASAHRGELMVREEEQRSHAEARIVLDTTMCGYSDRQRAEQPRGVRVETELMQSDVFEWTLTLAATLALHLEQRGFLVQLVETGPRQLASPDHVDEFLESVAAISLAQAAEVTGTSSRAHSRPNGSFGALFAVIADAEPATIAYLIDQRAQFGFAMAFIASPEVNDTAERLALAGWHCISAPPADSVVPLWESIAPLLEGTRAAR